MIINGNSREEERRRQVAAAQQRLAAVRQQKIQQAIQPPPAQPAPVPPPQMAGGPAVNAPQPPQPGMQTTQPGGFPAAPVDRQVPVTSMGQYPQGAVVPQQAPLPLVQPGRPQLSINPGLPQNPIQNPAADPLKVAMDRADGQAMMSVPAGSEQAGLAGGGVDPRVKALPPEVKRGMLSEILSQSGQQDPSGNDSEASRYLSSVRDKVKRGDRSDWSPEDHAMSRRENRITQENEDAHNRKMKVIRKRGADRIAQERAFGPSASDDRRRERLNRQADYAIAGGLKNQQKLDASAHMSRKSLQSRLTDQMVEAEKKGGKVTRRAKVDDGQERKDRAKSQLDKYQDAERGRFGGDVPKDGFVPFSLDDNPKTRMSGDGEKLQTTIGPSKKNPGGVQIRGNASKLPANTEAAKEDRRAVAAEKNERLKKYKRARLAFDPSLTDNQEDKEKIRSLRGISARKAEFLKRSENPRDRARGHALSEALNRTGQKGNATGDVGIVNEGNLRDKIQAKYKKRWDNLPDTQKTPEARARMHAAVESEYKTRSSQMAKDKDRKIAKDQASFSNKIAERNAATNEKRAATDEKNSAREDRLAEAGLSKIEEDKKAAAEAKEVAEVASVTKDKKGADKVNEYIEWARSKGKSTEEIAKNAGKYGVTRAEMQLYFDKYNVGEGYAGIAKAGGYKWDPSEAYRKKHKIKREYEHPGQWSFGVGGVLREKRQGE